MKSGACLEQPRESLAVEIKSWLDLSNPQHQAKIIKTAIALRNNNGGYMILGCDNSLLAGCKAARVAQELFS